MWPNGKGIDLVQCKVTAGGEKDAQREIETFIKEAAQILVPARVNRVIEVWSRKDRKLYDKGI